MCCCGVVFLVCRDGGLLCVCVVGAVASLCVSCCCVVVSCCVVVLVWCFVVLTYYYFVHVFVCVSVFGLLACLVYLLMYCLGCVELVVCCVVACVLVCCVVVLLCCVVAFLLD